MTSEWEEVFFWQIAFYHLWYTDENETEKRGDDLRSGSGQRVWGWLHQHRSWQNNQRLECWRMVEYKCFVMTAYVTVARSWGEETLKEQPVRHNIWRFNHSTIMPPRISFRKRRRQVPALWPLASFICSNEAKIICFTSSLPLCPKTSRQCLCPTCFK